MSKKDFEDLLNKHDKQSQGKEIDWENKKKEWLEFINQFYQTLENWLASYKKEGSVSYSYNDLNLTEEYIGTYTVRAMTVYFAGQQLTLEPIGALLIGSKGRIDMEGTKGRVQFVLADKNSKGMNRKVSISPDGEKEKKEQPSQKTEWEWKIVLRESSNISFAEFNEKNFFDALMEIVHG